MVIPRLAGILLVILGGAVMLGWVMRVDGLVRIHPEFSAMVFNTALGFALAGGALIALAAGVRQRAAQALSAALGLLAALILAEHLSGTSLGMDWAALHLWIDQPGAAPGRVSPGAAAAFLLSACALALLARARTTTWARTAVVLLASAVTAIGILAMAGYAVRARLLFPGYIFVNIAAHTAVGMVLLGSGLWAAARRLLPARDAPLMADDDRIAFIGASVLAAVAFASGLATFAVLQDKVFALAASNMIASQGRRAETFVDFIAARESNARIAATRPAAMRNLRALRAGKEDREGSNLANLRAVVNSFVKEGFSGIAYLDAEGRTVAGGGDFVKEAVFAAPLATPGRAELLWSDGFVLRHRIALRDAEGELGALLAEQPLPVLTRLARAPLRVGETADMGVCYRDGERLRCAPQRLNPRVFDVPLVNADGRPLPMTRALGGETSDGIARDYRGQVVVAAYGPAGDLGLGVVVKIDAAEVFAPVRAQLLPAAAVVLALVGLGALLLRASIQPLARRLVDLNQDLGRRSGELEAANKELEAFSYSVSHDLRAPLRHIGGFAEMLKEDYEDKLDSEGRRYLKTIREAVTRMGQLIDDLLGFSRMGRVELHREHFPMDVLVRETLAQLEPDAAGRNVAWDIGALPEVQGDRALLRQVWANLLSNALKYTRGRDPAKIAVACRREGEEHVFSVADNGAGFDMQYAGKLFGVFQRLHTQEEFEGTGVGLANVRRIVARHGGRTWAEGRPGEGATLSFTLPDRKEAAP